MNAVVYMEALLMECKLTSSSSLLVIEHASSTTEQVTHMQEVNNGPAIHNDMEAAI